MWFQVLSSAGLMSSSVTTRYASCTHGSAMARTIAEITLTKTPTCVVGWNCHSRTLSSEHNWWIFYKPTLSCYPRENISLSFLTSISSIVFWGGLFFSFPLKYISITSFVSFRLQQNIPVLLQGHFVAEMITSVFAQTKSAIKWMTVVTTRTKRSVVSTVCTITYKGSKTAKIEEKALKRNAVFRVSFCRVFLFFFLEVVPLGKSGKIKGNINSYILK